MAVERPRRATLRAGYHDIAPGKVAAVVTSLEMRVRPAPGTQTADPAWRLRKVEAPGAAWYRDLFRRIGEPWLWDSRLRISEEKLLAIIRHADVDVHALTVEGHDEGLVELDFRVPGECELLFFGVTGGLVRRGAGRFMMNRAIELAWSRPIERFWVHTCTLDHPGALDFYVRSGFRPYRLQVEVANDPRLAGRLPLDAAPHAAIIRPAPVRRSRRTARGQ
jgi:GNAT superfamily N-acetyltransferase